MSDFRGKIAARLREEAEGRAEGIWRDLGVEGSSLRASLAAVRELAELCRLADMIGGPAAISAISANSAKRRRVRKKSGDDDVSPIGRSEGEAALAEVMSDAGIGADGDIPGHREG